VRHTVHEPIDRQVFRPNTIEWRKPAAKHVIQASELTGTLDRADIRRFFDCTNECRVTSLIAADRAQRFLGEIEAALTRPNALRERHECRGEALAVLGGLPKQMVRET
jgi:hypothetical protein